MRSRSLDKGSAPATGNALGLAPLQRPCLQCLGSTSPGSTHAPAGSLGKVLVESRGRTLNLCRTDSPGQELLFTSAWPPMGAQDHAQVRVGAQRASSRRQRGSDRLAAGALQRPPALTRYAGEPGWYEQQRIEAFGATSFAVSGAGTGSRVRIQAGSQQHLLTMVSPPRQHLTQSSAAASARPISRHALTTAPIGSRWSTHLLQPLRLEHSSQEEVCLAPLRTSLPAPPEDIHIVLGGVTTGSTSTGAGWTSAVVEASTARSYRTR